MAASRNVEIGAVLGGNFRVESLLGEGGMGIVYRGTNLGTGAPCAMKVILPHLADRPGVLARFETEARIGAKMGRSPYIVDVIFAGVDAERRVPFLIMELLTGLGAGDYWEATTAGDLALAMADALKERPPASERAGDRARLLPPGFDGWFARCLEVEAARRWPSAGEAAQALHALFNGPRRPSEAQAPARVPEAPPPQTSLGRPGKRGPGGGLLVGGLLVAEDLGVPPRRGRRRLRRRALVRERRHAAGLPPEPSTRIVRRGGQGEDRRRRGQGGVRGRAQGGVARRVAPLYLGAPQGSVPGRGQSEDHGAGDQASRSRVVRGGAQGGHPGGLEMAPIPSTSRAT